MPDITINITDVVKTNNVKTLSNKTISYTQNNITVHSSGVIGYQGYTLIASAIAFSPADSTTYYWGGSPSQAPLTAENLLTKIVAPKAGTVRAVVISLIGNGSGESVEFYLRLNSSSDNTITLTGDTSSNLVSNYSMSVPIAQGDAITIKMVAPVWATNPVNLRMYAIIYID